MPARDHVVSFHGSDVELAAAVVPFLSAGFDAGDVVVVVATPEHRVLFERGLGRHDLPRLEREGRYVPLDAEATLAALSVRGVPNAALFEAVIGDLVVTAGRGGRRVSAFGEMVGLLWARGDVGGAVALEEMWNGLGHRADLALWCAYPAVLLADAEIGAVLDLCAQHAEVVPLALGETDAHAAEIEDLTERSHLFLPLPLAIGAVRRFLIETFHAWGADALVDDGALVATELATNAVRHASSPFRVTLRRSRESLLIAVHDASRSLPTDLRHPKPSAQSGRGGGIVAALSSRWGADATPDGKVVWAQLSI
jgi:anti-sigma regulatory factor (Ser/Thr protein kinase)